MKQFLGMVVLLAAMATSCAGGSFTKALRPEDAQRAGLGKLTPEEIAFLETLVEGYKSGEITQVQQQAEEKIQAVQQAASEKAAAAAAQMAAAEAALAKAKAAEAQTVKADAATKKQPGWFRALITLNHAVEKPAKAEPLVSKLVGDFKGWTGSTIFTLENGTRWQQQNRNEQYPYSPTLVAPVVRIKPATLTGFWLEIEGVNRSVRVIPIDLPDQK